MSDLDDDAGTTDRIRRATAEITGVPASASDQGATLVTRRQRSQRTVAVVSAACLVLVAVAVALTWNSHDESPVVVGVTTAPDTAAETNPPVPTPDTDASGDSGPVTYERVDIRITQDLTCATPIDTSGSFDHFVVESFVDAGRQRFKNTVTYPDASTRDLIVLGSGLYPTARYERGRAANAPFGCELANSERLVLAFEPVQGTFYALNINDFIATDDRPFRLDPFLNATRQEGDFTDSLGRTAELWRQTITGSGSPSGDPDETVGIEQVTDIYVDPTTDKILEQVTVNRWDTYGTTVKTETAIEYGTLAPDDDLFDTRGLADAGPIPRPASGPCIDEPLAPPTLLDGTPIGPTLSEPIGSGRPLGTVYSWGPTDSGRITQEAGLVISPETFLAGRSAGNTVAAHPWEALILPLDASRGVFVVEIYNVGDACLRKYQIGPGAAAETVTTFVQAWLGHLASTRPTTDTDDNGTPLDPLASTHAQTTCTALLPAGYEFVNSSPTTVDAIRNHTGGPANTALWPTAFADVSPDAFAAWCHATDASGDYLAYAVTPGSPLLELGTETSAVAPPPGPPGAG